MSKRVNSFQRDWLHKQEFRGWLASVHGSVHRAKCKLCVKTIDIGNMGVCALRSHMKSTRHCNLLQQRDDIDVTGSQQTLGAFNFMPMTSSATAMTSEPSSFQQQQINVSDSPAVVYTTDTVSAEARSMYNFATKEDVTKAEGCGL
jgi:hypothetical protein